jgi:hypothetical protein
LYDDEADVRINVGGSMANVGERARALYDVYGHYCAVLLLMIVAFFTFLLV